jgi:hypothetical protein
LASARVPDVAATRVIATRLRVNSLDQGEVRSRLLFIGLRWGASGHGRSGDHGLRRIALAVRWPTVAAARGRRDGPNALCCAAHRSSAAARLDLQALPHLPAPRTPPGRRGHDVRTSTPRANTMRIRMNKQLTLKATLLAALLLALPVAHAQVMSKVDYKASKARISADYKSGKAACANLAGNTKDICVQEAKAKEKVALADLEFSYTGKDADRNKALVAKADGAYSVAKEKCDDQKGNAKDVCVKEAKSAHVSALADAKMGKEIGQARKDATADKVDAEYKVALEKCDALAGDAKSACVSAAKAKSGKS